MAKGNAILLEGEPRGKFTEGIMSGTPKPGTCMQIVAATEPVGGRYTWQIYDTTADGDQRLVAVLLEDNLQGKTASDAYVTASRCFLYIPCAGDELNMLIKDVSGTGDDFAIGDLLMIDDGTGKLVATTGSPEMESFICLETVTNPTADHLMHCMYTGH